MDTHLRCTGGVKRERIARTYTIPAAVSACLKHRSLKRQGVTNTETEGADLSRSDMDKWPGRFGGGGRTSFSSVLTPIAADVVVGCKATQAPAKKG
jgi:hypothetical protein